MSVSALLVPVDDAEALRLVTVDDHGDVLPGLVDDVTTDTVFLDEVDGVVVVAGNGKTLGMPVNHRATALVTRFLPGFNKRDRIHGTALFLGTPGDGDSEAAADGVLFGDVPAPVKTIAEQRHGTASN